ncbi:unnamed protein product [Oppiella nova]|uniref:C2H2-type domain-containing protein n=1 Tax=Oppiella nova TaxID=334625 RepID=A0A7R9LHT2_9ACAR|nr:unnamed protein product [Oppiella nova]CAG2163714.1 unnamed protein product [Oppiella nova]
MLTSRLAIGCHKSFKNNKKLNQHLIDIHKPFPCDYPDCQQVFQYSSADYWDNRSTRPEATDRNASHSNTFQMPDKQPALAISHIHTVHKTTPLTACIPVLNETSTTIPENTSFRGKRNANHSPTTVQSSPKRIKLRESKELPVPATHIMDTITCSSDSDSDIEIIAVLPGPNNPSATKSIGNTFNNDSNIDDIEILDIDISPPEVVDNNDTKPTKQLITETPVPDPTHNTQDNCVPTKSEVIYLPVPPMATILDFSNNSIKNESPINIAIDESMDDVPESPVCVSRADSFSSVARSSDNDVLSDDDDSEQSSDVSDETRQLCQRYDNLLRRVSNMLRTNTSADNGENPDINGSIDHSVSDSHCPSVDNPYKQITGPPEANTLATDVTNKIIGCGRSFKGKHFLKKHQITEHSAEIQSKCNHSADSASKASTSQNRPTPDVAVAYDSVLSVVRDPRLLKRMLSRPEARVSNTTDCRNDVCYTNDNMDVDCDVISDTKRTPIETSLPIVATSQPLTADLMANTCNNESNASQEVIATELNTTTDNTKSTDNQSVIAVDGRLEQMVVEGIPLSSTSSQGDCNVFDQSFSTISSISNTSVANTDINEISSNITDISDKSLPSLDDRLQQMIAEGLPLPSTSSLDLCSDINLSDTNVSQAVIAINTQLNPTTHTDIQSTTTAPHDSDEEVTDQSLSLISNSSDVVPDHSVDRNPSPSTSVDNKSPPKAKSNKEKPRLIAFSGCMRSDGYLCSDSDDDRPELESFDGLMHYMSSRLVTNTRSPSPVIPPVSDTTSASPVSRRSLSDGEWSDKDNRDCDKLMASLDCDVNNCDKQFDNRLRLNEHKFIAHKILEPYVCGQQDCGKRFERSFDYVRHRRSQHLEHIPYRCEYTGCGNWFAHRSALKYHIKADHMRALPFCCDYDTCDEAFKCETHLYRHIRDNHITYYPFECDDRRCVRTFISELLLNQHKLKVHAVPYPYVCDYKDCSERFAVKEQPHTVEFTASIIIASIRIGSRMDGQVM